MEGASAMKTLPDYLPVESRLVIVGCNPSLTAGRTGFYYSGRGNQFWSHLYDSGIVPERLEFSESRRITERAADLRETSKCGWPSTPAESMHRGRDGRRGR